MSELWSPEQIGALERLVAQGLDYNQIARELERQGIRPTATYDSVRSVARAHRFEADPAEARKVSGSGEARQPTSVNLRLGEEEGNLTVDSVEFKDMARALEIANVDLDVWEVKEHSVKFWTTPMKIQVQDDEGHPLGDRAIRVENAHIEIKLRRKVVPCLQTALTGLVERVLNEKPLRLKKPIWHDPAAECILLVGIFDHHFGKLAWQPETGDSYDLKIADRLFREATEEILRKSAPFGIQKIVFPLGNDFLHIDTRKNRTEAGTEMDSDGRFVKIYETALMAVYRMIEFATQFAPIEVIWVPGNHDPNSSYHLTKVVQARYQDNARVRCDAGPAPRKYLLHGVNLVGLIHGDDFAHQHLPRIMADEVPDLWAKSTTREWLTGHYHQKKKLSFIGVDPKGSVTVRVLPSLCGTDYWHFNHGFTGGPKAAEGYIYHGRNGFDGQVSANARLELLKGVA